MKKPYEYVWSSAKEHSYSTRTSIIDTQEFFNYIEISPDKWKIFIDTPDHPEEVSLIRKYTMTGRPLGSESFVKRLEKQFGESAGRQA